MRLRTLLASTLVAFVALSASPAYAAPSAQATATALVNTLNKKLPTYTSPDDARFDVTKFAAILPDGTISAYTVNTETENLVHAWNVNRGGNVVCVVFGLNDKFISAKGSCISWYAKNRTKIMAKSMLESIDLVMADAYDAASATAALKGSRVTIAGVAAELAGAKLFFTVTKVSKTSITVKNEFASATYRIKGSKISR